MKSITVAYQVKGKQRSKVVKAQVIGPLAVHRSLSELPEWTITHIATGRAIYRFIESSREAVTIAKKLEGQSGWAGTVEEITANKKLKTAVIAVLAAHGIMVKA